MKTRRLVLEARRQGASGTTAGRGVAMEGTRGATGILYLGRMKASGRQEICLLLCFTPSA